MVIVCNIDSCGSFELMLDSWAEIVSEMFSKCLILGMCARRVDQSTAINNNECLSLQACMS